MESTKLENQNSEDDIFKIKKQLIVLLLGELVIILFIIIVLLNGLKLEQFVLWIIEIGNFRKCKFLFLIIY